jgi:lipid-binding SYLF domain-containing protein
MSQNVSDRVENENISTETESIAVNDPSFNVIHQPHIISNEKETKSFVSNIKEKLGQTTTVLSDSVDFSMPALLKQARFVFENFVDPKLSSEQRIPFDQLGDVKGVMFLSVVKGGFGVGGLMGSGIIIARNPSWKFEWSAPAAIAIGGLQIGVHAGIEKTDHIIFIRDEEIITKFRSGLRLGGDIGLCVGTLGRNANVGMTLNNKGVVTNVVYSMSKGIYLGFALEGAVITVRNDCNEGFLGQKSDISDILNGSLRGPFNEDYNILCKELGDRLNPQLSEPISTSDKLLQDEHHPILKISSEPKTA